jgi:2'-5' RNA ligase
MRLFFAALPDRTTAHRIAAAARELDLDESARRVACENYHMTLAFVGEVPASKADTSREVGGAQRGFACAVRFDAYAYWSAARVVVAAASECPAALRELWCNLHADLARCGFALDPAPFRPHVTLARKVSQAPVLQAMSEFFWTVHELRLMCSVASPTGPVYTVVDTWPLLDGEPTPT